MNSNQIPKNLFTTNRNSMLVVMNSILFKMVNSIVGTNIKSKYTALPDSVLFYSFVNCLSTNISRIPVSINSKLAQSPLLLMLT